MNYGYIICHNTWNALGRREPPEYEIEGGPFVLISPHVLMDYDYSADPPEKTIKFGPYKLHYIGWNNWFGQSFIYALDTFWLWRFYAFAYKMTPFLRKLSYRFLATLAIWNLAEWGVDGRIPSWRNIRLPFIRENRSSRP